MKKNKIIMSIIFSVLLSANNSVHAIGVANIAAAGAAASAANIKNKGKEPIYEGKVVRKFEIKTIKEDYVEFLIDNDGDENTIEHIIRVVKKFSLDDPSFNKLKQGSTLKYKDHFFGENNRLYLDHVFEVDGVKTR